MVRPEVGKVEQRTQWESTVGRSQTSGKEDHQDTDVWWMGGEWITVPVWLRIVAWTSGVPGIEPCKKNERTIHRCSEALGNSPDTWEIVRSRDAQSRVGMLLHSSELHDVLEKSGLLAWSDDCPEHTTHNGVRPAPVGCWERSRSPGSLRSVQRR